MSSISGIGGNGAMMMQHMKRPDPTQMAEDLFSKLDTSSQGYLTKADLQSAVAGTSSSSSRGSSSVDNLFSKLDGNGDGKVTKQEFSDTLKKMLDELSSQFMQANGGTQGSGMGGGMSGMGGMPPPPAGDSGGMTKDQLTSAVNDSSSTDSAQTSALKNLVSNFDKADTNGDGKVSFKEAMDYKQKTSSSDSTSTSASSSSTSSTSSSNNLDGQVMQQIMKLMQAYGFDNNQTGSNSLVSKLSVTA